MIESLRPKATPSSTDRVMCPRLWRTVSPTHAPRASGSWWGVRHSRGHITRSVLEGVAFGLADGLDVFDAAQVPLTSCLLVGGGSRSAFWTQMIADVLQVPLDLPGGAEIGAAFGAARLGMLAAGASSEAEICTRPPIRRTFTPDAGAPALFEPRLARFRALYAAEKTTRSVG